MGILPDVVLNKIDVFLLVFIRMAGLFVIAPIFGRRSIPSIMKIGFAFLLALILMNVIPTQDLSYYNNIYSYVALIFKEVIVGITLGYVAYLIFTAIQLAGQLIDMQVGFGMVSVIDPVNNIQVPISANFYFMAAMLAFLTLNGHHDLIRALFESYSHVPLGAAVFSQDLFNDIMKLFGNIFLLAFKISAPIIGTILITDVTLGIISKTVPQLNVFVIGMPLKIILGVLAMIITMPMFLSFVNVFIEGMNSEMLNFLKDMVQSK